MQRTIVGTIYPVQNKKHIDLHNKTGFARDRLCASYFEQVI